MASAASSPIPALNFNVFKDLHELTCQAFDGVKFDAGIAQQIVEKINQIVKPFLIHQDERRFNQFKPNIKDRDAICIVLSVKNQMHKMQGLDQQVVVVKKCTKHLVVENCVEHYVANRNALLKRLQAIALDYLKALEWTVTSKPAAESKALMSAITANNVKLVEDSMNKGVDPRFVAQLSKRSKLVFLPEQVVTRDTGLGIVAANGSSEVVKLFLDRGVDPNFFIQFVYANRPTESDRYEYDSCNHNPMLPPWLSAAISSQTTFEQKKGILEQMLVHEANPLLLDSEGNFWFTHVLYQPSFDPRLTRILFAAVKGPVLFMRTTLLGTRITLIQDLLNTFDRIVQKIDLKVEMSENLKKRLANSQLPLLDKLFAISTDRELAQNFEAFKNKREAIRTWQASFLNNVTALIREGAYCSEELAKSVESRLKLETRTIVLDSSALTTVDRPFRYLKAKNNSWIHRFLLECTGFSDPQLASIKSTSAGTAAVSSTVIPERGSETLAVQKESPMQIIMDYLG